MFDTMTLTKAVGAGCGALLAFLLVGWAGQGLYGTSVGGHGDEVAQAYVIETASSAPADEEPAEVVPFVDLVAAADAAAGQKVFGKCAACHKVDGTNATGPHLDGVVGRPVASVEGFGYSDALKAHGGEWTLEALNQWLSGPKDYIPGNKMSFAGLPKAEDRNNVITYLKSLSN